MLPSPPTYVITEFREQDQDQVIGLIDSLLKQLGVIPNVEELIDDEDLFRIPDVYSGKGRFWVALAGNEVVGTVALRDLGANAAKLNRMFVRSDYWGTGLGQALLDTALTTAKAHDFQTITLNTHPLMNRAHHFMRKMALSKSMSPLTAMSIT